MSSFRVFSNFNLAKPRTNAIYRDDNEINFGFGVQEPTYRLHAEGSCNVSGDYFVNGSPLIPTGTIMPFAGANPPQGYLLCDGSAIERETYSLLFNAIGTFYGVGDGSTTFNLPDFRGRVSVGAGIGGGGNYTLANTGGAPTHTLTVAEIPAHGHTGTTTSDGEHTHTVANTVLLGSSNTPGSIDNDIADEQPEINTKSTGTTTSSTESSHNHTFTSNDTGGGEAHNNMQPYLVVNYIIRY